MRPELPTVPLEAGAGPENPPCPACGEPLFPWIELPVESGLSHRCEACGLGVLSRTGTAADAVSDLERGADDEGAIVYENRASLQARLTGGAWSGIGTDRAYRFTPDSIRRLVANRDQVVDSSKWMPGAGILSMWQSGINMFTFGHNLALGRFGRAHETPARKPWRRRLDTFITVVLAVPSMVFAIPFELLAGLVGRGGVYRIRLTVL